MDLSNLDKLNRQECLSCPRLNQPYVKPTIVRGSKLMAIAEAPAKEEVEVGQVLVGPAGRMLSRIFEQAEVERDEVSLANVVACYAPPVRDKKGFLAYPEPTVEEIEACSSVLEQAIEEASPVAILALGGSATRRLVGERKILKWRGSTMNAPATVKLGLKTVLGPALFKSGKRKGELKPRKVEAELTQKAAAGKPVVLTLHPSMCLPDKLGPVSGLTLVVPDVKRARLLSDGSKLIKVGREILSHVEDASLAGIILESSKLTVCDVETDGKFGKLTLVGLAPSKDYAATFRPDAKLFLTLAKAFAEKDRLVIGHNFGSYDTKVLERQDEAAGWPGLKIESKLFDTMHAIRFERPDLSEIIKPAALERACSRLAGYSYYNWKEAFREGVAPDIAYYCAMDCSWTFALYEEYRARLERSNRLKHFEADMMPALKVLTKLEQVGIQVDKFKLSELQLQQAGVVARLDGAWNAETGGVNYRSQAGAGELRGYFYKTLKLPVQFTGRGKTRRETLDEEACEKLARLRPDVKALQILVSLRHADKILSTYLNPELDEHGRFHPQYNLTGAETGRFSGDMQQVPRTSKSCVSKVEGCVCGEVREVYVADEGDEGLASGDFEQIEFRLWGPLAHDPAIDAIYAEGGHGDIHGWAAERLMRVKRGDAGFKEARQRSKPVTHGGMFERGAKAISEDVGCSLAEAQALLNQLAAEFAVTWRYKSKLLQEAQRFGYITNPFSRRIYFPVDYKGRVKATEVAASAPQSTAAGMIQRVLVSAWKVGLKVRGVLHDELLISARVKSEGELLKHVMEESFPELGGFSNPVSVGIGANWASAKA